MCCQQRHCVTYININTHTPKPLPDITAIQINVSKVVGPYIAWGAVIPKKIHTLWIFGTFLVQKCFSIKSLWGRLKHLQTCSIGNIGITLVRSTVIFILSIYCLQQCVSAVEMTGNLLKHSFTNLIACPLLNADTKK